MEESEEEKTEDVEESEEEKTEDVEESKSRIYQERFYKEHEEAFGKGKDKGSQILYF